MTNKTKNMPELERPRREIIVTGYAPSNARKIQNMQGELFQPFYFEARYTDNGMFKYVEVKPSAFGGNGHRIYRRGHDRHYGIRTSITEAPKWLTDAVFALEKLEHSRGVFENYSRQGLIEHIKIMKYARNGHSEYSKMFRGYKEKSKDELLELLIDRIRLEIQKKVILR